jgi:hypothetical protein
MVTDEYSLQDLLEQFKGAMEMSSTPVSEIQIITENNASWFGVSQSWSFWSLWG